MACKRNIDAIDKKWVYGWIQKGFAGKKNKDLWIRLMQVYKLHQVKLVWVALTVTEPAA